METVKNTTIDGTTLHVPPIAAPTPSLLEILIYPDKRLNRVAEPVTEFNVSLQKLIYDMFYTMSSRKGIGLAGPQVNVPKRVVVLNLHGRLLSMVNPEIVNVSEELYSFDEGCLSVPGYFEMRKRPIDATVKYQTVSGTVVEEKLTCLDAFAVQHEIDHLNGKLFVDGVSELKRDRIKTKIRKTMQQGLTVDKNRFGM